MRLNQFIAAQTGISRRQADELIEKGQVEFNGELGQFFQQVTEKDTVKLYKKGEWEALSNVKRTMTVLFYKPIFCLTTREDSFGRKTIYNLLPRGYQKLKSAGRLDYMSEGLLVLSEDGDLLQKLTHPKNETEKEYLVGLKHHLKPAEIEAMKKGMQIEEYDLNPVTVIKLNQGSDLKAFDFLHLQTGFVWYKFILSEGRNNQIRKMCEACGQKVLRLIRISQGQYKLTKELFEKKIIDLN